jgi:hypothetical protein
MPSLPLRSGALHPAPSHRDSLVSPEVTPAFDNIPNSLLQYALT